MEITLAAQVPKMRNSYYIIADKSVTWKSVLGNDCTTYCDSVFGALSLEMLGMEQSILR